MCRPAFFIHVADETVLYSNVPKLFSSVELVNRKHRRSVVADIPEPFLFLEGKIITWMKIFDHLRTAPISSFGEKKTKIVAKKNVFSSCLFENGIGKKSINLWWKLLMGSTGRKTVSELVKRERRRESPNVNRVFFFFLRRWEEPSVLLSENSWNISLLW